MDANNILLALLPLILILLGLEIFALVDLARRDPKQVQGGKKWVWVLIILLLSTIGPIIYLVAGRTDGENN